jgi:hypothetical protein
MFQDHISNIDLKKYSKKFLMGIHHNKNHPQRYSREKYYYHKDIVKCKQL